MMANAEIVRVGPGEYGLVCDIYNQIFVPPVELGYFEKRLASHKDSLCLVAQLDGQPAAFLCGYALRPTTFYSWLCGVLPDARRMGVAGQLFEAEHAWAAEHGYQMLRLECNNKSRPALQLAIAHNYDIVGIRWDVRSANNLVIFEKVLDDSV